MCTSTNMISHLKTTLHCLGVLLLLVTGSVPLEAQPEKTEYASSSPFSYDMVIREGLSAIEQQHNREADDSQQLSSLVTWYTTHPLIEYASCVERSITVRFIDGSYVVLFDPLSGTSESVIGTQWPSIHQRYLGHTNKTAVILNPAESMYGHHQCQRIITTLLQKDYSIEYLANQAVDVSYIRNNLSASIIYMNTHAGYFDVDGDLLADAVVIATGEPWTNETEIKYAEEIQNHLIVKGMVGDQGFVTFTPAFIEQYYSTNPFPGSLVFMATCYALADSSMAQAFLNTGASVYLGWSQNTVFWTNSRTSVQVFHLLALGVPVQLICRMIRSGGFYNWLFHSKLMYIGDGTYTIP